MGKKFVKELSSVSNIHALAQGVYRYRSYLNTSLLPTEKLH